MKIESKWANITRRMALLWGRTDEPLANTAESLALLKTSFGGNSERDLIVSGVEHLGKRSLRWLDIGIGDCLSTFQITSALEVRGIKSVVYGIDPELNELSGGNAVLAGFSVTRAGIEDTFAGISEADVINIRQSLYYAKHQIEALFEVVSMAKPGAAVFVTHWGQECDFRKLQVHAFKEFGVDGQIPTAEEIYTELGRSGMGVDLCFQVVPDTLNIGMWTSSDPLALSAFEIASRGRVNAPAKAKIASVKRFVESKGCEHRTRRNALISITKK